jgi:hypothetical protein
MLVQVDGWSGSGKSVLMYLLDGHPEVYSHPFHDLLQFLFRKINWEEDWVLHKDIWELRNRLVKFTQYYKSESFIRQGKYYVEFKSDLHLKYNIEGEFSKLDEGIISELLSLKNWTPQSILTTIFQNFQKTLIPSQIEISKFVFMGGWRGVSNSDSFKELYPDSKRIVIKRDIKDIIAVQLGRKPMDIDFRSKYFNNKNFESIIASDEILQYHKYYDELELEKKKNPNKILIIDFREIIDNREIVMKRVCEFLEIRNLENWSCTFLKQRIEYNGIDYSEQVLDKHEELLTDLEIKKIENYKYKSSKLKSLVRSFVKFILTKNINLNKKIIRTFGE